ESVWGQRAQVRGDCTIELATGRVRPSADKGLLDPPVASQAETGRGSADLREPSAAFTKLLPSSHIGPGDLRHSVSTPSSALTNMSSSFSPMISGGRIFITSIA